MTATEVWIAVLAAALISFLARWLPVALLADRRPSPVMTRAGSIVVPVAFAVLAASALAGVAGGPDDGEPLWAYLVAGLTTVLVARRHPGLIPLAAGMAVLWLLLAL